ncbi:MAG: NGG1p interacting factor NIF3 [Firmicutes bacterium]|nr:NGG1p interacting factor NIF3 [Bacillota bacterium]
MDKPVTVTDVVEALDRITGGRVCVRASDLFSGKNRFVVTKSSGIPGKAVTETPGLVFGDPSRQVKKLAVCMTLTESQIELAGATGVDAIVAHHPVADAANSGGVTLKVYLGLYGIAVLELHEAFHGLHPGIQFLHGHKAFRVDIAYGGIPGNVMSVGKALDDVKTAGDVLRRLAFFMGYAGERDMLMAEREVRGCASVEETNTATGGCILNGSESSKVGTIIHIHPHTGFTADHLQQAVKEHPEIDTVISSISRVRGDSDLVAKAKELGLTFILGNSHAMEILENGVPLAAALQALLPPVEVVVFRERVSSYPLGHIGTPAIREYGKDMAGRYLLPGAPERK